MSDVMKQIRCNKCVYIGEYDDTRDEKKIYMIGMFGLNRESHITIRRKHIDYNIEIKQIANRKTITVIASQECVLRDAYGVIMEIMRFENLFEGLFFPAQSFLVDGVEQIAVLKQSQLAYYNSEKRYAFFQMDFSDKEYKSYFHKWLKLEKKMKIIHPVFLFSTYLEGMPVDVRMALLLETFEPIAEDLHNRGEIVLVKSPYKHYSNRCKKCGNTVTRAVPNKELTFADKIKPLIKKYGKDIFATDNKRKLIAKSVKVRNKVDHVKANTENVLKGNQCGFYIYKFSLMYRYIILLEIGLKSDELLPTIKEWVLKFDYRYTNYKL